MAHVQMIKLISKVAEQDSGKGRQTTEGQDKETSIGIERTPQIPRVSFPGSRHSARMQNPPDHGK